MEIGCTIDTHMRRDILQAMRQAELKLITVLLRLHTVAASSGSINAVETENHSHARRCRIPKRARSSCYHKLQLNTGCCGTQKILRHCMSCRTFVLKFANPSKQKECLNALGIVQLVAAPLRSKPVLSRVIYFRV